MASLLDVLTNINPITSVINTVIDRIIPDKAKAQEAKDALAAQEQQAFIQQQLAQIQTNTEEAKSSSIFVSGWRPWCGWVGGMALFYASILEPMARFFSTVVYHYSGSFPVIDTTITLQILLGLLGLGGMRTVEKLQDKAAK